MKKKLAKGKRPKHSGAVAAYLSKRGLIAVNARWAKTSPADRKKFGLFLAKCRRDKKQ